MTKFDDALAEAKAGTLGDIHVKTRYGPARAIPHELALELYEFNGGMRKTTRALEALGYTNPRTGRPWSYFGVRGAILYAQRERDRQKPNDGETEPG